MLKGFDGAKTASIARAAGVTHAMLHYYFRTKEQLFDRILTDKLSLMGRSVLASFGTPDLPVLERLKRGIGSHFDFLMENPDLPRFIVNEVFSRPERYAREYLAHSRRAHAATAAGDGRVGRAGRGRGHRCAPSVARHCLSQRLPLYRLSLDRTRIRPCRRRPKPVFRDAQGREYRSNYASNKKIEP